MHGKLKSVGLFTSGLLLNGYLMFHAAKANESYNNYLSKLPQEELEKMRARDWYLNKNGRFFGSGIVIAERAELNAYNAKSKEEQEAILTQYRWAEERRKGKL